jgi:plastocyanin
MHRARVSVLVALVAVAAACTSSVSATWTYAPAPPATPTPSATASGSAGATASIPASVAPSAGAPSAGAPSAGASAAPSAGGGATIELTAQGIAFDKTSLQAPAGQGFQIKFHNADAGVPHNVAIKDASGTVVFKGEIFSGDDTKTYDVPALQAGAYQFLCQVHTTMVGTLTVGG